MSLTHKVQMLGVVMTGAGVVIGWVGAHLKLEPQVQCFHPRGSSMMSAPYWMCSQCGTVLPRSRPRPPVDIQS